MASEQDNNDTRAAEMVEAFKPLADAADAARGAFAEPWSVYQNDPVDDLSPAIYDCDKEEVCMFDTGGSFLAERIVACVNAMDGIADPAAFVAKARADADMVMRLTLSMKVMSEETVALGDSMADVEGATIAEKVASLRAELGVARADAARVR